MFGLKMKLTTLLSSLFGTQKVTRGGGPQLLKKIIRRIGARIRGYKAKRKLKKSGYKTWSHYYYNNDPDVNRYGNDTQAFYVGYPYVFVCTPSPEHYAYKLIYDYGPGGSKYGCEEIAEWCEKHIRWNYRIDCHRVLGDHFDKLEFNDISGWDVFFFAFKKEKDFTHFMLRWS